MTNTFVDYAKYFEMIQGFENIPHLDFSDRFY